MNDLAVYNSRMRKSLLDKIFFMDKIDGCDQFLDYGCADGSMIKFLAEVYPDNQYFGYDRNQDMIAIADTEPASSNVGFSSDFSEALDFFEGPGSVVIASSILHEIYDAKSQDSFWFDVSQLNPDYLVIRDMCVSRSVNRMSDPTAVAKVHRKFGSELVERWENRWGNLHDNRSLVHFLLKYRFTENWDTEFRENYLSYTYESLLNSIPEGFTIVFNEHYTLHHVKSQVKKDFDIDLQDRTHVKLILKKVSSGT